jgi:hypothetical protein
MFDKLAVHMNANPASRPKLGPVILSYLLAAPYEVSGQTALQHVTNNAVGDLTAAPDYVRTVRVS